MMDATDMAQTEKPHAAARRTQRVQIALPLIVRGEQFHETTSTIAVSAHGCLVMLKAKAAPQAVVWLINPKTAEEIPGRVVSAGKPDGDRTPLGIEFSEPSPLFWRINFPPDDWMTSLERKRHASDPSPKGF
jgi:hypothetical protein